MAFRPYSQIDIAFSSVPWDRSYSDVPDFSDDSELLKYLESAIVYTFSFITADNARAKFNLEKDGITQPRDVIVPLSSIAGANISEPLEFIRNVNYMVARYTNQSGGYSYEYYFITDIIMVRPDVVKCSLEMDVFQTYRLNYYYGIKGGVVERKHCERFVKRGEDIVIDTRLSSPARISDEIESQEWSLKPIKQTKIDYSGAYDFYDDNSRKAAPIGWLCVFYDVSKLEKDLSVYAKYRNAIVYDPYGMVCFPIFNSDLAVSKCELYSKTLNKYYKIGKMNPRTVLSYIADSSNGYAKVSESWIYGSQDGQSIKNIGVSFAKQCPFFDGEHKIPLRYIENDNSVVLTIETSDAEPVKTTLNMVYIGGVKDTGDDLYIPFVDRTVKSVKMGITAPYTTRFSISEMKKNQSVESAKEPKLLSPAFYKISLFNPQGGSYDYNAFDAFTPLGFAVLTSIDFPDPSAPFQYIGLSPYEAEPSILLKESNAGLIYSATASIPLYADNLAEYLRSNKNAYLTSVLSAGEKLTQGVIGSALSKNPRGVIAGAFSAVSEIINYQLKTDSLANAPINITFSKVSPSFIYLPSDSKFSDYIIYYSVSDADKAVIFDYFHRFGYPYNKTLDSENWFNRHYYDYIKLATPSIQMIGTDKGMVAVPTPAREKIAQALNRGVTFWHDMDYWQRYDIENWEKDIYEVLTK